MENNNIDIEKKLKVIFWKWGSKIEFLTDQFLPEVSHINNAAKSSTASFKINESRTNAIETTPEEIIEKTEKPVEDFTFRASIDEKTEIEKPESTEPESAMFIDHFDDTPDDWLPESLLSKLEKSSKSLEEIIEDETSENQELTDIKSEEISKVETTIIEEKTETPETTQPAIQEEKVEQEIEVAITQEEESKPEVTEKSDKVKRKVLFSTQPEMEGQVFESEKTNEIETAETVKEEQIEEPAENEIPETITESFEEISTVETAEEVIEKEIETPITNDSNNETQEIEEKIETESTKKSNLEYTSSLLEKLKNAVANDKKTETDKIEQSFENLKAVSNENLENFTAETPITNDSNNETQEIEKKIETESTKKSNLEHTSSILEKLKNAILKDNESETDKTKQSFENLKELANKNLENLSIETEKTDEELENKSKKEHSSNTPLAKSLLSKLEKLKNKVQPEVTESEESTDTEIDFSEKISSKKSELKQKAELISLGESEEEAELSINEAIEKADDILEEKFEKEKQKGEFVETEEEEISFTIDYSFSDSIANKDVKIKLVPQTPNIPEENTKINESIITEKSFIYKHDGKNIEIIVKPEDLEKYFGLSATDFDKKIKTEENPKYENQIKIIDQFLQKNVTMPKIDLEDSPEIPDEIENLAEKSVMEDEYLISEALAKIFIKQGNTERAKKIYEQLILLYPQKSSYFASLIEKLS